MFSDLNLGVQIIQIMSTKDCSKCSNYSGHRSLLQQTRHQGMGNSTLLAGTWASGEPQNHWCFLGLVWWRSFWSMGNSNTPTILYIYITQIENVSVLIAMTGPLACSRPGVFSTGWGWSVCLWNSIALVCLGFWWLSEVALVLLKSQNM